VPESFQSSAVPYPARRSITGPEVDRAADELLRAGERPTVEKVRAKLGRGSPNTVNPLLDAWWKRLASRLDAGPAALHRLPQTVAHVAESLWIQALEEGRRRAMLELRADRQAVDRQQQTVEVRSHVLTLREGELESRLHERERELAALQDQLRALTTLLRKEQAAREHQLTRTVEVERELANLRRRTRRAPRHFGASSHARRAPAGRRKPSGSRKSRMAKASKRGRGRNAVPKRKI